MSQKQPFVVVGIEGSPRAGGNTEMLLDAALQGAAEKGADVVRFRLNELDIKPCQGCGGCDATGKCVINDDMSLIYSALENMDALVLSSPIYFGGVTAQTKAMIDRCQAFWARKYLLKKPISDDNRRRDMVFLSVLGSDKADMIEGIRVNVKYFFDVITLDGDLTDLIFPKVEHAGEIADHWEALGQAREAGAKLVP
ncbi:MAG: flavodoxin family protein [Armatimonadota bacterium]